MIDAAGKNGDIKLAHEIYQATIKAGMADVVTYASMIDAAGKNKDVKLAEEIFKITNNAKLQDIVSIHSMVKVYYMNHQQENAEKLYLDSNVPLKYSNDGYLDLHGFNEATAYFAIKYLLGNGTRVDKIITGRGLHSEIDKEGEFPVRVGVQKALDEFKLAFTPVQSNPGMLTVTETDNSKTPLLFSTASNLTNHSVNATSENIDSKTSMIKASTTPKLPEKNNEGDGDGWVEVRSGKKHKKK